MLPWLERKLFSGLLFSIQTEAFFPTLLSLMWQLRPKLPLFTIGPKLFQDVERRKRRQPLENEKKKEKRNPDSDLALSPGSDEMEGPLFFPSWPPPCWFLWIRCSPNAEWGLLICAEGETEVMCSPIRGLQRIPGVICMKLFQFLTPPPPSQLSSSLLKSEALICFPSLSFPWVNFEIDGIVCSEVRVQTRIYLDLTGDFPARLK